MNPRTENSLTAQNDVQLSIAPRETTVTAATTGTRIDVAANLHCHWVYSATLAFLDAPLKLRQPIPVTVKHWTDGTIEAHLTDALLYGTGDNEAEALDDLREHILDAWKRLSKTPEASMAKPAWRIWTALKAVCNESALA